MTAPTPYTPPTSLSIKLRQNDLDALRLLIAQRRLYKSAKRWVGVRWIGMIIIGIGAPVVSVLWPSTAVVLGAVAGAWTFFGRTALLALQTHFTVRAAAVQELFDFYVYQMPERTDRASRPSLEDIAAISGPDSEIQTAAADEKLLDWYPVDEQNSGTVAIAIAQRANASYSDRLLRSTAITWSTCTVVWIIALIVASIFRHLSLAQFVLGIALPILPAFLDVVQYITGVWRSAQERRDLTHAIEAALTSTSAPLEPANLLVWQERLFELRRSAPEVPDFIYRFRRSRNEDAMHTAAQQMGSRAHGDNDPPA